MFFKKGNAKQSPIFLNRIQLPANFHIEVYARGIKNARSLTISPKGIVFVSTRENDKVYAIIDSNNDQKADYYRIIAENLRVPNGVAFYQGDLYVAEISRVLCFDNIENRIDNPPRPRIIRNDFPKDRHHGWKFIRFSPENLLYIPIGAPCNVCEKKDSRYSTIMRMKPDGTGLEIFAKGVRNTVGFDWHPVTKELWFTDNGRDWLGDNSPPDELNRAPSIGFHFGFPYCHGTAIADPKFGKEHSCSDFVPPAQELGPHVAALGMRFYTGEMFPSIYHNQIFIAEHGSWNRSAKIGYRVTMVRLKNNKPYSYEVFAEGWLKNETVWGRPVDLLVMPDGSLLVSDDYAHAIYRIYYLKS